MASGDRLLVKHEGVFKRGKVIGRPDDVDPLFVVSLVDYGSIEKFQFDDLFTCNGSDLSARRKLLEYVYELPIQCFECRLSEVIPAPIRCPSGWSDQSTEEFRKFIEGKNLEVEVNSFVNNIAYVQLIAGPVTAGTSLSLNEHLVIREFARRSDDPYAHMIDQIERKRKRRAVAKGDTNESEPQERKDELADCVVVPPPKDQLTETLTLDGPYSPLETRLESLSRVAEPNVTIDKLSVNHVLFDPYPSDAVKKVLVAATMSKGTQGLSLQNTTILPHLPGIGCLAGLIFSPLAEIRSSKNQNRHTSILTGLGCDASRKPFYGEHDCLIDVDVELDGEDFKLIDELRLKMSHLIQNPTFQPQHLKRAQSYENAATRQRICSLMLKIMSKDRRPLGILKDSTRDAWNWKPFVKLEHKVEAIYPKLSTVEIHRLSEISRRDLKHHADELEHLAATSSHDTTINCQLCEERIETVTDLQVHVMKTLHKERSLRLRDETN